MTEPRVADVSRLVPRLVSDDDPETIHLIFELISNAISLQSQLDAEAGVGACLCRSAMHQARAGTAERYIRNSCPLAEIGQDPRLEWLSPSRPWAMTLNRSRNDFAARHPMTPRVLRLCCELSRDPGRVQPAFRGLVGTMADALRDPRRHQVRQHSGSICRRGEQDARVPSQSCGSQTGK